MPRGVPGSGAAKAKVKVTRDIEIRALQVCCAQFDELDEEQTSRVMVYLTQRYGDGLTVTETDEEPES